ncbi:HWE histidine kinase domain-containing protein [Breoghania sp. L-A4]|uniref:sensor histidine kinase n=1 Tax=Breoghania sp. L-A4 TaxID=2304600 RepID=UPI0020BF9078|nr:HWE histidine kinase domain-containing protein [Breoghania sp. L-A4]
MGARIRAYDWSATPLGPPDNWPQSLRVTVRLMLNTNHPMFIWWGPDLIQLYNDAYAKTMGPERHPSALGQRGRDCWDEIWDIIGPQIDYVMSGKGSTWDEDRLVPITRHGQREDVWWTYSYGPIDTAEGIGGVLVICNDVTAQHLANEALKNHTKRLTQYFDQAPGFMTILRGPDHVFEFTNAAFRALIGERDFIGRPMRDILPELEGQGLFELLDDAFESGTARVGKRMPLSLHNSGDEATRQIYIDFVYQPIIETNGVVSGIFVEGIDVSEQVRAEAHLRLINNELKHRVKNTLAIVSAIASQTLRGAGADAAVKIFQDRLGAFGKAHDILTAATSATAPIMEVVDSALAPHRTGDDRFRVSGPPLTLGSKQSLSLALAIHELSTNAIKYGALSNDRGTVDIDWHETSANGEPVFTFHWKEHDGPRVTPPTRKGFGSQLISRTLTADFGADIDVRYDPEGLEVTLTAPIENLHQIDNNGDS